jgi:hypothetical protein
VQATPDPDPHIGGVAMSTIPDTDPGRVERIVADLRGRGDIYAATLGTVEADVDADWMTDRDYRQRAREAFAALDQVEAERGQVR